MFGKAFKATFGVGCALIVGFIIIVFVLGSAASQTAKVLSQVTLPPTAVPAGRTAAPTAAPQSATKAWTVVKQWSGSGIKDTEDFTVGDQWRVDWDFTPGQVGGIIQVYVYNSSSKQLVNLAANTQKGGADTSFQRGAGTYYLKINSANGDWKVAVQDQR